MKLLRKKIYKVVSNSRFKQFVDDYKIPLTATLLFAVVLGSIFGVRTYERSILAATLTQAKSISYDYASLLSGDTQNSGNSTNLVNTENAPRSPDDDGSTSNSQASAAVFTVTPTNNSQGGVEPSQNGGTTPKPDTPPPSGDNGGATPSPALPFNASISSLGQEGNPQLNCSNIGGALFTSRLCSRKYSFAASIRAVHGPGTVGYAWGSSTGLNTTSSFSVSAGETFTTVRTQLEVSCDAPGQFTIQIKLTSPTQSTQALSVSHSCPGIL